MGVHREVLLGVSSTGSDYVNQIMTNLLAEYPVKGEHVTADQALKLYNAVSEHLMFYIDVDPIKVGNEYGSAFTNVTGTLEIRDGVKYFKRTGQDVGSSYAMNQYPPQLQVADVPVARLQPVLSASGEP